VKRAGACVVATALALVAPPASPSNDAPARLFSISKSENRNYVQYAERLDASCAPAGDRPVFAYWQMLEHGPVAVEPLLARERPAYGLASQTVVERHDGHGSVRVILHALPDAPLLVESWRDRNGVCQASAQTPIAGVAARLFNVHAVLRWPFGVARILVSGWAVADGQVVHDARMP